MSRGSSASYAGIIKYRDFSKKIFPLEKYETAKKKKEKEKDRSEVETFFFKSSEFYTNIVSYAY